MHCFLASWPSSSCCFCLGYVHLLPLTYSTVTSLSGVKAQLGCFLPQANTLDSKTRSDATHLQGRHRQRTCQMQRQAVGMSQEGQQSGQFRKEFTCQAVVYIAGKKTLSGKKWKPPVWVPRNGRYLMGVPIRGLWCQKETHWTAVKGGKMGFI